MRMRGGRKMDAAVHRYVFGRRVGRATGAEVPHYSTDMAAAWMVLERMFERGFYPEIRYYTAGTGRHDKAEVYVIFHVADHYCGFPCADNAVEDKPRYVARAICRAALLAVCGD
ncbi:MAG: hypothetical protein DIU62_009710 [Pseudomonadota bacterium]